MATSRIPDNIKDKAADTASSASQTVHDAKGLAKETASTIGQKASEAASNLGHKAQDLASTAADKGQQYASAAADTARHAAHVAGEKTDDALSSVGQGMRSLAGNIRQNAPREGVLGSASSTVAGQLETGGRYLEEHGLKDIGEDATKLVRQYPVASLLAVFGFGFLLGSALRR